MFDKWEEEKYKQTSSVSIRHGVGDGITDLDGLSRRSTVKDVLEQLAEQLNLDPAKWVIVERWRGTQKILPPRTRILRVWHAWCNEQVNVQFWLQRANHKNSRNYSKSDSRRKKKSKVKENWSDTDSFTSDSSDSSFAEESLNTSEDSDLDSDIRDDELKIELLDLLSDQQAKIEGNRKINLEIDKQIKQIQDVIDSQKIIFSIYHYHQQVLLIIAKPEMKKNTGTFRLKWSTVKLAKLRKKYTD